MAGTKKPTVAIVPAEPHVIVMDRDMNRRLFTRIVKGSIAFLERELGIGLPPVFSPLQLPANDADRDVMTADEVAAFLGVDRNTVYDYAGRGVIPHQRLGKRMLFRRGALVSWLDQAKVTSARRG